MIKPFHLITVYVEDWSQSTLDLTLPVGDRGVANTSMFLECLAEVGVRAKFS